MMMSMTNNREKILNFDTEQVYSYGSETSRTDICLPYSRLTNMIHKFFIGTVNLLKCSDLRLNLNK